MVVDEVGRAGRLEQLGRQLRRLAQVVGERHDLVDQIARLAAAQLNLARLEVVRQQRLDDLGPILEAALRAGVLEDLQELGARRALRENLVVDAAQERLVDQLVRPDVRREDDQRHEREVELLAGLQREEVDAALERHDPAVQQLARRAGLAAEVVDDEHAAVGDRLHRRAVEARASGCSSARADRATARRRP